jgi:hypothetical protein
MNSFRQGELFSLLSKCCFAGGDCRQDAGSTLSPGTIATFSLCPLLAIIIPTRPLRFAGWLIDDGLTFGSSAGTAVVANDQVEDRDAGDKHRQNRNEPEFHSHIVILRLFMDMFFASPLFYSGIEKVRGEK